MSVVAVLMLHGKLTSGQDSAMRQIAERISASGYDVAAPNMPWALRRMYDKTVDGALHEIDDAIADLRAKGAQRIVLVGFSLGANVAIRYAATRGTIDGVIALAPGHNPDAPAPSVRLLVAEEIERAKALVDQGKGDGRERFLDFTNKHVPIRTTAKNYISWWGPDSALAMPKNVCELKCPLLFAVSLNDGLIERQKEIFKSANPTRSRWVEVGASQGPDHFGVPDAAAESVCAWLTKLFQ